MVILFKIIKEKKDTHEVYSKINSTKFPMYELMATSHRYSVYLFMTFI